MSDKPFSMFVPVGQTGGTITIEHGKSGLQWIIWQLTVETIPARLSAQATLRKNGRYVTSTIVGSGSSAQGPPAILLNSNDVLTVLWIGMQAGDELIATPFYEEVPWGQHGTGFGLV